MLINLFVQYAYITYLINCLHSMLINIILGKLKYCLY